MPGPTDRPRPNTGEYQKVFRRSPPTASSSDVHEDAKVPIVTDVKTLELFARALQNFATSSASMTHAERRRYKWSTGGLIALSTSLLAVVGMLISNIQGRDTAIPTVTVPVPVVDDEQIAELTKQTKKVSAELALVRERQDTLVRLQIEQWSYLVDVLSASLPNHKRLPPRPRTLVDAEDAALVGEPRR